LKGSKFVDFIPTPFPHHTEMVDDDPTKDTERADNEMMTLPRILKEQMMR